MKSVQAKQRTCKDYVIGREILERVILFNLKW